MLWIFLTLSLQRALPSLPSTYASLLLWSVCFHSHIVSREFIVYPIFLPCVGFQLLILQLSISPTLFRHLSSYISFFICTLAYTYTFFRSFRLSSQKFVVNSRHPPQFSSAFARIIWPTYRKCGKIANQRHSQLYIDRIHPWNLFLPQEIISKCACY